MNTTITINSIKMLQSCAKDTNQEKNMNTTNKLVEVVQPKISQMCICQLSKNCKYASGHTLAPTGRKYEQNKLS